MSKFEQNSKTRRVKTRSRKSRRREIRKGEDRTDILSILKDWRF